jgi:hypothetical protein
MVQDVETVQLSCKKKMAKSHIRCMFHAVKDDCIGSAWASGRTADLHKYVYTNNVSSPPSAPTLHICVKSMRIVDV